MNAAHQYNHFKAEAFSIYHKNGMGNLYQFLHNIRSKMSVPSWYGLKAELEFYHNYKKEFTLDPLWDYGIKADFSGDINGHSHCRIDVTTNIAFKKLQQYEPVQRRDGRLYKIVVMNKDTGKIDDIVDLNFPYDKTGHGRLLDVAIFEPSEVNGDGCLSYNYYQRILSVSSYDAMDEALEKNVCTDIYLPDIKTFISEIPDDYPDEEYMNELNEYLVSSAKFLSKEYGHNIVACGQRHYRIDNPKTCEGEYVTKLYWKHPVIEDYLPDEFDFEL